MAHYFQPKAEPDQVDTLTFWEFSDDFFWLYLTLLARIDDDDDDDDDHY